MKSLHIERAGAGPVLVMVHGYLGGSAQWSAEIRALGSHLEVIALDLPGFGRSRHLQAPDHISGYAKAVLSALDELGIQRFHLLGHSMGGMVVQDMVRLAPERVDRLVLYATGPLGLLPGRFETMERSRERLKEDGVEVTARRISATWLRLREASSSAKALGDLAAQASSQAAEAGLWAMERWDGRPHLERITQPTMIVWGDQDRSYQWPQIEALWRGIAGASLAVVPRCAHALHLENPVVFHQLLRDFLADPSTPAPSKAPMLTTAPR